MTEFLKDILPGLIVFGSITLIEVTPIKLNPWKWLFSHIGNMLVGDIQKDLQDLKNEFRENKVQNLRWNVLDFANSCRNGRKHSHDEWRHTISQLAEYEDYIEANKIPNGIFEEDAKYLREVYQELCKKNDFL